MRVTILGSGGSAGVPATGHGWGDCDPAHPRNRRRRVAILVEQGDTRLLVDTPPDLREQLVDAGVTRLDGVLFTHAHADHLHGIDDLRGLNQSMHAAIPCWATIATLDEIQERFAYVFRPLPEGEHYFYKPTLIPHPIRGPFKVGEITVLPFEQDHGFSVTTGFHFGRIAYSTDVVALSDAALAAIAGVDLWIVDCLQYKPHVTHAHLDKTLSWIEAVRPRRAVLTHLSHKLDYAELSARLPPGVEPAYDGMTLEIP